jgi:hypothetical protein
MTEPNNPNIAPAAAQPRPANPAPAPATQSSVDAAETKAREASAEHQKNTSQKDADASAAVTNSLDTRQAVAEQKSGALSRRSSNVITNPASPVDPDAPVVEVKPDALPQSTIDEMEAGKKALERNKPVAQALEAARDKPAV